MRLWDFVLATWSRPGVESACLDLQDTHRHCVALWLWRAWAVAEGRAVDLATLAEAVALARDWEVQAVAPVRAARRALSRLAGADAPAREAFRAAELAAERALLTALEASTPVETSAPPELTATFSELARAWNGGDPETEIATLVRALR